MHSDQYVIIKDGSVKKCFSIDNVCSRSSLSHVLQGHLILVWHVGVICRCKLQFIYERSEVS